MELRPAIREEGVEFTMKEMFPIYAWNCSSDPNGCSVPLEAY